MKALAIDPGETSGLCYAQFRSDSDAISLTIQQHVLNHDGLYTKLRIIDPDFIIFEEFEYRPRAGSRYAAVNLYPKELIGVIKLYGARNHVPLYAQKPAQAKGGFPDNLLKDRGVYTRGLAHGRDAVRHMLYWFEFGAGFKYFDPKRNYYEC